MSNKELAVWVFVGITITFPTLLAFNTIMHIKRKAGVSVEHVGNPHDAFNNIAVKLETLVGLDRLDEPIAQDILESVINGLALDCGWVDVEESLVEFQDTPFIVQAFKNCGYNLDA